MTTDKTIIDCLKAGHYVIVSDAWLDSIVTSDVSNELRVAHNARRLGTKDAWVAWIGNNPPGDLTYDRNGQAYTRHGRHFSNIVLLTRYLSKIQSE